MKKNSICILAALLLNNMLFSQPVAFNGFRVIKDMKYQINGGASALMDLYLPGGETTERGIGVNNKESGQKESGNSGNELVPLLIWLPGEGKDKFPNPVASYVGNDYAVASLQCGNETEVIKNTFEAINYLRENPIKYNIDINRIGILQPSGGGYTAVIWNEGMEHLTSLSEAKIKQNIKITDDVVFLGLQSSNSTSIIVEFFDNHLRNGIHKESDPLSIICPSDSWVDPITNPVPGTSYHLFPTLLRGNGTFGSYLIYLPKDYSVSNQRYPVIYWLHGGNGNSRQGAWMCERMDAAMKKGTMPQCIVVFVQGLPIGWYNNSKDGTMPVEDVIIKDLIPHIDATYRTIKLREARGIDGMSMGGYGSLHLGFKYPELFGVVSSIAPSITTYEMERKEVILPTFEDDVDYFNANSPTTLIQNNAGYIRENTIIRLLVGDQDFLYGLIQKFHQQLTDLQINHQYAIAKGADHDYREVVSQLDFDSFTFWATAFKHVADSK